MSCNCFDAFPLWCYNSSCAPCAKGIRRGGEEERRRGGEEERQSGKETRKRWRGSGKEGRGSNGGEQRGEKEAKRNICDKVLISNRYLQHNNRGSAYSSYVREGEEKTRK